ncbi:Leucine-rich_repeat domain superfamily [Hexamita inflata]|uniref:Leucine-rich repeat domain superfamily n=1 Tax=Hexamita inflata TaxID=28002 RepID=A0AA86PP23_9EUKA|nr:Leucine-rich repeat domain superfamily [Hexamita inflata]
MITDISVLSYLHWLETVYLDHNKIQNIQALAQLQTLIFTINVSHNYIQNLSPLLNRNYHDDKQDTFVQYSFESSVSSTQNNIDALKDLSDSKENSFQSSNNIGQHIVEYLNRLNNEIQLKKRDINRILTEHQLKPTQLETIFAHKLDAIVNIWKQFVNIKNNQSQFKQQTQKFQNKINKKVSKHAKLYLSITEKIISILRQTNQFYTSLDLQ